MKALFFELMSLAGLVSLGFGLYQMHIPTCFAVMGSICFILGSMGAVNCDKNRKPPEGD